MNDAQKRFLDDAYRKFEAGNRIEALKELRDLSQSLDDPWDRAELLYHETLWLEKLDAVKEARERLEDLRRALHSLTEAPADQFEIDIPVSLTVMAGYAEITVLLAEKNESEALRSVERLLSKYPKQLSNPDFRELFDEINAHHGFLLADAGRWIEARPILEAASYPREWKNVMCFYLGHCYYEFREYQLAKSKLTEAFELGLVDHWASKAHYVAGIVECHLGNMSAGKRQFESYLKTATPTDLGETKIWEWLEYTCRALGEYDEAERYRRRRNPPAVN